MKKLNKSVLAVVLTASFSLSYAQKSKADSAKTKEIGEVVVTALGIKKEKNSLGYSTQTVKGEDLARTPTDNFTSNLSGKVAGLSIKNSGNVGGSVDVVLRGYRSMTGGNQALFVVDGVPMINNYNSITSSGLSIDTGNTISDINPNDIADINVLKGASATALYGSRGANGVILITTKRGKNRLEVEFNTSVAVSAINKSTFPTYQKTYGEGYGHGYSYAANDQFDNYGGQPMAPTYEDASYGAAYDPNLLVWQYTSFMPGNKYYGKPSPWVAGAHDPSYFFETAAMYNNAISLQSGNEVSSFRLSYQNVNGTDILPNSSLNKNSITGNASYKLTDKLTANMYATFVHENTIGKNPTGYHGITGNFRQWWAGNVDIYDQKQLYETTHQNYTWNILGTNGTAATFTNPAYWNNPYFLRYQDYVTDSRDRFAGNFSLSYDVNKHFNVLMRMSTDGFSYFIDERRAVGSLSDNMSIGPASGVQPSGYAVVNQRRRETNYDLIATYKNTITERLNIDALVGSNVNLQSVYSNAQGTQGGLFIPGVYSVTNSASTPALPLITDTNKQIFGLYAEANLGLDNTYFLGGNVRRDVSSALPKNNRTYYYYSGSASVVISNWEFLKNWSPLSFGKVRASIGMVGNDTGPNQLMNQYTVTTSFGTPTYYYNTTAKNPLLKPELTKATEVGANLQFFQKRFGIDFAWFRNDTYNQIIALPVSYGTGVANKWSNAGNMRSSGLEFAVNITPVKAENFRWDANINWSNPKSKVTKIAEGNNNILLGSFQGGVTINATLGQDYGTIKGTNYVYDSTTGQPMVAATGTSAGKYLKTDTNSVIGNMQADWFGSITNRFTYKNVSLSFQIDWRQGGQIFSLDQYYGQDTGIYPMSVFTNDLGKPVRNTLAQGGGLILPGVKSDGSGKNNIRIDASSTGAFGYEAYPAAAFVYSATYVKLREVALTYSLPKRIVEGAFIKGASFSLVGNNLWIIKKYLPYADPESGLAAGNVQGYQTSVLPTTRTISFNVKLNF